MSACVNGHIEVVKVLLAGNADVNIGTRDGMSALMWAQMNGYSDIAAVLKLYIEGKGEFQPPSVAWLKEPAPTSVPESLTDAMKCPPHLDTTEKTAEMPARLRKKKRKQPATRNTSVSSSDERSTTPKSKRGKKSSTAVVVDKANGMVLTPPQHSPPYSGSSGSVLDAARANAASVAKARLQLRLQSNGAPALFKAHSLGIVTDPTGTCVEPSLNVLPANGLNNATSSSYVHSRDISSRTNTHTTQPSQALNTELTYWDVLNTMTAVLSEDEMGRAYALGLKPEVHEPIVRAFHMAGPSVAAVALRQLLQTVPQV